MSLSYLVLRNNVSHCSRNITRRLRSTQLGTPRYLSSLTKYSRPDHLTCNRHLSESTNKENSEKEKKMTKVFKWFGGAMGRTDQVSFNDIAGYEDAKIGVMKFVAFLRNKDHYRKLGARIPRGVVLQGKTGTGKTLLAKAVAGEANVPFLSIKCSECTGMFGGVGRARVRELFQKARKQAPCIIYIDEIDAIGCKRSAEHKSSGDDVRVNTLNQLLVEMDRLNRESSDIVVLAGTNSENSLDSALMMSGRFAYRIYLGAPDIKARVSIFMIHMKPLNTNLNMLNTSKELSTLTAGFTGGDIVSVCNEAAVMAACYRATAVEKKHLLQAIACVIKERSVGVLSPEERKIVAYHEAGHALVGWFVEHCNPPHRVSILASGETSLGHTAYLPKKFHLYSKEELTAFVCIALGGRASEQIFFGTVTTGSTDDLKKATWLVYEMITQYGMNEKVGNLSFNLDANRYDKPYSSQTGLLIDTEARKCIEDAYQRTLDLLLLHKKKVSIVAEELLKNEVLTKDDMVKLLGPHLYVKKTTYEDTSMPVGLQGLKEALDKSREDKSG